MSLKEKIKYLVVDTTAFIKNNPLQEIAENLFTVEDVVNEITNKRQLRRLVVLPYDLNIKEVFPENIKFVTEFSKKTGDYQSLSATDIKVIALTYQLEKEYVGTTHLNTEPKQSKHLNLITNKTKLDENDCKDKVGFFMPEQTNIEQQLSEVKLDIDTTNENDQCEILHKITNKDNFSESNEDLDNDEDDDDDDDEDEDEDGEWITPNNIKIKTKELEETDIVQDKVVTVACVTSDFAMQNVLKQISLNVSSYDGKIIKQLRTFIFRCYTCFKTTSVMTKVFCPNCGNQTLKKVAVSIDENGKQVIHINTRKPLTARGKKFSLPTPKGGKHANNPILFEDQRVPDQKPTRLAKTKTDSLASDYIAGYSPFVMRDVTSKSAMLGIRSNQPFKHWMRKNPNETKKKRK